MKLGEWLVSRNTIGEEALKEALDTQRFKQIRIGRLLRELGHITDEKLDRELAQFLECEFDMPVQKVAEELANRMTKDEFSEEDVLWAESVGVTLFGKALGSVVLFSTSFSDAVVEAAEKKFGCNCILSVLAEENYRFIRSSCGLDLGIQAGELILRRDLTDDQKIAGSDPFTSLFRDTVLAAKKLGSSDIHVQPTRSGLDIRFRVNGDLMTWKQLGLEHRRPFVNAVKSLTNLSIAISGRTQDARTSFADWQLDLRASLLPSQYGEKIVLRLLDLTRRFEMSALGLDPGTLGHLNEAMSASNGVVIVSGPTGSGKTTTLYTLLSSLDRTKKNILTLEDPIEYGIPGLTQVQITRKLSFPDALRAVLRQDPDVILVGEIRDAETADLCVKAASTGHLVLSTLHANGASEVVGRLLNLGVEPYLLRSVLRFSAAQRLLKRLCPDCSIEAPDEAQLVLSSRFKEFPERNLMRKRNLNGCPRCNEGVVGRLPVLEYMSKAPISDYLINPKVLDPRITVSLQEAAFLRAMKGEVDFHDVLEIA